MHHNALSSRYGVVIARVRCTWVIWMPSACLLCRAVWRYIVAASPTRFPSYFPSSNPTLKVHSHQNIPERYTKRDGSIQCKVSAFVMQFYVRRFYDCIALPSVVLYSNTVSVSIFPAVVLTLTLTPRLACCPTNTTAALSCPVTPLPVESNVACKTAKTVCATVTEI